MNFLKKIQRKIKLDSHSETRYQCPFCGYQSEDLETVGHNLPMLKEKHVIGGGKRAAGCYKCHSRDRERLLYAFLIADLKLPSDKYPSYGLNPEEDLFFCKKSSIKNGEL
ncbi:hypothetical protein [Chryseobacterium binzhouense]|uniref:hypothetical protein n=1 Tax=Chryseobacterium binzhouense TaxID=2593646 RepID=UPI00117E41BA|nr:hypothetical protein [Chryseobacterium binzhouense]